MAIQEKLNQDAIDEITKHFGGRPAAWNYNIISTIHVVQISITTTNNKQHNQEFLYNITQGINLDEATEKMLQYIRNKSTEMNYTVQWSMKKGDDIIHTSYFRAHDMYGVLNKLHYDRDKNTLVIFNIQLSPLS